MTKNMMDIKFIRENEELMKKVIKNKKSKVSLAGLLDLDEKRRDLIAKSEGLKANLNKRSKTKPGPEEIKELKKIGDEIKAIAEELSLVEKEYNDLMLLVPNVYSDDTPVGNDETSNKEILKWGKLPKFNFEPKDHVSLGKELNILDLEAGTKTAGYRGYYLKNEAVLLHFAIFVLR